MIRESLRFLATRPTGPLVVALLAVVLTLPSLGVGLLADDHGMYLAVRGSEAFRDFPTSPLDLFRFFNGDAERVQYLMDAGVVPWWTYPRLHAAFWRPVSSATHFFDYAVWGDAFWVMHLESVLLYGSVCFLATLLYRRVIGATAAAGLAALLFAADASHVLPVAFLANRNALLGLVFGIPCILAHRAWRCDGRRFAALWAHLFLVLSLLSAEVGLAICAYLAAHALCLDPGPWRKRLWPLATYAALVLAWRAAWVWQGYGMDGCGIYTDPVREPMRYLAGALVRGPLLLLSQWFGPPAELSVILGPGGARVHLWVALAGVTLVAVATWPLIKARATSRFFALGMVCSLAPLVAAFPSDRMLLFAGVGAFGLMSEWMVAVFSGPSRTWPRLPGRAVAVAGAALLLLRAVLSPVFLAVKTAQPIGPPELMEGLVHLAPMEEGDEDRDVIVVNPPLVLSHSMSAGVREVRGLGNPRSLRMLAPGWSAVDVHREGERTLVIRAEDGFRDRILPGLFRSGRYPLRAGERIALEGLLVEVLEVDASGTASAARFTFDLSLEDDGLKWFHWSDGANRPFVLPGPGETVTLPGIWGG